MASGLRSSEEHWPQVHAWHSESGTKDYIRVIGIMLAEKAERNEDVETLINMLGRTSRPKVRSTCARRA